MLQGQKTKEWIDGDQTGTECQMDSSKDEVEFFARLICLIASFTS